MRLFVGVPIPEDIKQNIAGCQKKLSGDISLVSLENLHFTLKFLGEVPETKVNSISERLSIIVKQHNQFTVSIKRVGSFSRVIWAGAESNELLSLAEDVQETLADIKKENYDTIKLHLTIARIRSGSVSVKNFANEDFGSFVVDRFVLFRSVLTSAGSQYTVLKEFALANKQNPKSL
jgi:2'-5' RNA ligase